MHIFINGGIIMKSNVTISMDSELKKEADELFSDLGMNFTTAVNVFVRQAVSSQRLPFAVRRRRHVPNAELLAAMEEADRIAHDPSVPGYTTMEALKKALNE